MARNDNVGYLGQVLNGAGCLLEVGRVEVAAPLPEEVAGHDGVRGDDDRKTVAVEA